MAVSQGTPATTGRDRGGSLPRTAGDGAGPHLVLDLWPQDPCSSHRFADVCYGSLARHTEGSSHMSWPGRRPSASVGASGPTDAATPEFQAEAEAGLRWTAGNSQQALLRKFSVSQSAGTRRRGRRRLSVRRGGPLSLMAVYLFHGYLLFTATALASHVQGDGVSFHE